MIKFRNRWNKNQINEEIGFISGETPYGESETIPDETLTLRELIRRHQSGQQVPVLDAQYEEMKENITFPDVSKMTKIEAIEFGKDLTEFIKSERKVLKEYLLNKNEGNAQENKTGEGTDKNPETE